MDANAGDLCIDKTAYNRVGSEGGGGGVVREGGDGMRGCKLTILARCLVRDSLLRAVRIPFVVVVYVW